MNPPSLPNAHHAAPRSPAPPHPSPPPQPPPHSHPPYHSHHLTNPSQHHQRAYDKHYENDAHQYDHQPSHTFENMPRANHLHLPGVNTYIEHYHYYNFNGNCTVQQASGDGQPNTIRMVSSNRPQTNRHPQNPHEVPPPHHPLSSAPHPASESHRHHQQPHHTHDPYSREPPRHRSSLPQSHLAPLSNSHPMSAPVPHLPPHTSLLSGSRFPKAPPPIPDPPHIPPQPPILPRLRPSDQEPPILAPLQASVPTSLSPLHREENMSDRPTKKSRLSRSLVNSHAPHETNNALPTSGGGGVGSESQRSAEDRAIAMSRNAAYGILERGVATTNSSSPSGSEYPVVARAEGYERNNGGAGSARAIKSADEAQSNDWEAVVEMYTTGKGTEDGVALKLITKGDGRRVSDRKLLEKRRTIGKTFECLGVERFERAIGYKWENGVRRKQKMYHVISRCRVVNAMRKAGESIPTDCEELTRLINGRIAEKEALKAGMARRNGTGGSGVGSGVGVGIGVVGSGMGHSVEESGRMRGLGHEIREGVGGGGGEVGGLRGSLRHGRSNATNGYDDGGGIGGRDEDEIRPGRAAHDRGRYA